MANTTIKVYQGNAGPVTLTLLQPDGVTPYDLTGKTVVLSVRRDAPKSSLTPILIQKTQTVFTNPTLGEVTFTFAAVDTSTLGIDQYIYDVQITGLTTITTAVVGVFKVYPEVN